MGYFNPHFFTDPEFVELPVIDAEFDEENEAMELLEALVVYDAFGAIKHTVTPTTQEARYE